MEDHRYYDELNKSYRNPKSLMHKKLEIVTGLFRGGERLLDVGCGTGELLSKVRNKYKLCVGIDSNLNARKISRERFQNSKNVRIIKTNILNFKGNNYDSCALLDILEHSRNPNKIMKKVFNALKHNSEVIITVPNWYDKIKIMLGLSPYHKVSHSIHGWSKILRENGFKIDFIRAVDFPLIKSSYLSKKLYFFGMCLVIRGIKV